MRDEETTRLRIPLDWVIVDALGAILAGAGAYGLLTGPGGPLPLLSVPGVAWLCIAFGVGLMVLALTQILKRIMRQRAR
jgi:amino acid transporter